MKAQLKSKVELWEVSLFAELAIWEPRPELQRLCAAIPEGGVLSEAIINTQLPGLSTQGRKNLLRHLVYLRLVDQQYRLTSFGRHCVKTGEAPAWEQGVYYLLVAVHQLFLAKILDFIRIPGDGRDRDYEDLKELPVWLKPSVEHIYTSALEESRKFSLTAIPAPKGADPVCRVHQLEPALVTWNIDLLSGENSFRIEGKVGQGENVRDFRSAPQSIPPARLKAFYGRWEKRWDPGTGRVAIEYDGRAGEGVKEDFLRSWRYKDIHLSEFGTYESISVKDIPVGPASNAEADIWARAIMASCVGAANSYITPEGWAKDWKDTLNGTPLTELAGRSPAPETVDMVGEKPVAARIRWLLSAAAEIGMGV